MRYGHTDVNVWFVVALVAAAVLLYLVTRLTQRARKNGAASGRRDPDRGGSGYTPVANVPTPVVMPDMPRLDPVELWLLGFSAPRSVSAGADPFTWDPGSDFASPEWRTGLERAERGWRFAASAGERAAAVVSAAWWIRVGVAGGDLTVDEARERTRAIADAVRADASDWFTFGDLLGEREGLAPPSTLYRPGFPWSSPTWPAH